MSELEAGYWYQEKVSKKYRLMTMLGAPILYANDLGLLYEVTFGCDFDLSTKCNEPPINLTGKWVRCIKVGFDDYTIEKWYCIGPDLCVIDNSRVGYIKINAHRFDLSDIRSERPITKSPAQIKLSNLKDSIAELQTKADELEKEL